MNSLEHIIGGNKRLDSIDGINYMYEYIQQTAKNNKLEQTLRALPYARQMHEGQFRKGSRKTPYIYHPLIMSVHAISIGLIDDLIIASALLHDVCEDCGKKPSQLPVSKEVQDIVKLLTKEDSRDGDEEKNAIKYYDGIKSNKIACIVKLLDRCNNISEMYDAFSQEKMQDYIDRTRKYVYSLFDNMIKLTPKYSNQAFLIKYHMLSVISAIEKIHYNN